MRRGLLYLVAIVDWATRKVLAWRLSNTMPKNLGDVGFRIMALEEALTRFGTPDIFNTDQGQPVQQLCLHRRAQGRRYPDQHGRWRALDGRSP